MNSEWAKWISDRLPGWAGGNKNSPMPRYHPLTMGSTTHTQWVLVKQQNQNGFGWDFKDHLVPAALTLNIDEDESLLPSKPVLNPCRKPGAGSRSEEVAEPPLPAPRDSFQSPPRLHTDILRRLVKHCGRCGPDLWEWFQGCRKCLKWENWRGWSFSFIKEKIKKWLDYDIAAHSVETISGTKRLLIRQKKA